MREVTKYGDASTQAACRVKHNEGPRTDAHRRGFYRQFGGTELPPLRSPTAYRVDLRDHATSRAGIVGGLQRISSFPLILSSYAPTRGVPSRMASFGGDALWATAVWRLAAVIAQFALPSVDLVNTISSGPAPQNSGPSPAPSAVHAAAEFLAHRAA